MRISSIILFLLPISIMFGQTVSLPFDFESFSIATSDFTNFDGGTGTVIPNPYQTGINTSGRVGQIIRNGGQVWAGAYLTTPSNVDFSISPIICMKVYTTAPVGTRVSLKMEGCGGPCFSEVEAFTSVSGAWELLCYDFTGQPASFDRLVFLFDLGNTGNGTSSSTFLFDDVEQYPTPPLFFTPGSQYFCETASLTLTYPGSGTYNWYADPGGTALLLAGSSTYTTPVLSGNTSYFVRDMTPTPLPATDVGPTSKGSSDPESGPASVFFTSNIDNGFWYSADIVEKIVGGGPPPYTCQYTVTGLNLTQGTSQSLTWNHVGASDNAQWTYNFPAPVPMDLNDNMELRVVVSGDVGCYISSHHSGGDVITSFPTASSGGELLFTSHTPNPNHWMGFDYRVSGDFIDPTLFQVNAIDDCANPLPVELLDFTVREHTENALLTWTTASEINNDYFEVRRSRDAINFETIGTVGGVGYSSSLIEYSFTDSDAKDGVSYYQLAQVDFDGTTSLSWIEALNRTGSSSINLYPNPTEGAFTISGDLDASSAVEIQVLNLSGRVIAQHNYSEARGAFLKVLETEDYPKGIYSVSVRLPFETKVFRLVKQ